MVAPPARAQAGARFERPATRADELRPSAEIRFLELPPRRFVMIDGTGPPEPAAFASRMPGLYTAAWSLRFALKAHGVVTRVGPLEGLWWTAGGPVSLDRVFGTDEPSTRDDWRWTLMIGLPDEASDAELATALDAGKGKLEPPFAEQLRLEPFHEGRVAQVLHRGPYATERPTLERLHAAIAEAGLEPRGAHHELYLSAPGRGAPENLKTILRQAVD